jgi:hypothetical protein
MGPDGCYESAVMAPVAETCISRDLWTFRKFQDLSAPRGVQEGWLYVNELEE